jgi:hypothetical protein
MLRIQATEVWSACHWYLDCTPQDLFGFDKLIASDPTRLHAFLVPWLKETYKLHSYIMLHQTYSNIKVKVKIK